MTAPANPIEPRAGVAYRPDVDGLRGVAVIAVVLYHAFPSIVPSGFVGVDVFFVVSGFLITSIVLDDLVNVRFSFAHFYARRIRRLFPALAVVLACAFAIAWVYLLKDEFRQFSKHVAGASAFVSNLVLWGESGYFDTEARAKPLLHLWSLGIEEQFYLLWPFLVWLAWRGGRRTLAAMVTALALVSFAIELRQTGPDPVGSFFSPVARFWELLAGAFLAARAHRGARSAQPFPGARFAFIASPAAALALVAACFVIEPGAPYPGLWALLPVLATVVLIAAGPATWLHRRVLGSFALVQVGLISYPLYLWHWPLLSFAHVLDRESMSTRAMIVVTSVVLAWATYRLVERPIRFGKSWPRARIAGLVGVMATIGVVGWLGAEGSLESFGSRQLRAFDEDRAWTYQSSARLKPVDFGATDFPGAQKLREDLRFHDKVMSFRWIDSGNPRKALFVGDSHAEHLWSRADQLIIDRGAGVRSAVFLTASASLPIPGVREALNPQFEGLAEAMFGYALSRPDIDTVVIASMWDRNLGERGDRESRYSISLDGRQQFLKRGSAANEAAYASLREAIVKLRKAGKRVFLVQDGLSGRAKVTRSLNGFELVDRPALKETILASSAYTRSRIEALARDTGAEVIDPIPALCPDGVWCPLTFDGVHPVYLDERHYSDRFMRLRGAFLDLVLLQ